MCRIQRMRNRSAVVVVLHFHLLIRLASLWLLPAPLAGFPVPSLGPAQTSWLVGPRRLGHVADADGYRNLPGVSELQLQRGPRTSFRRAWPQQWPKRYCLSARRAYEAQQSILRWPRVADAPVPPAYRVVRDQALRRDLLVLVSKGPLGA